MQSASPFTSALSRTKALSRPCPLCDASEGEVLHTQEYAAPPEIQTQRIVDVVGCPACGLVFADVAIAQTDLDKVYEEHSKYADTTLFGRGPTLEAREAAAPMPPEAPWDLARLEATADYLADQVADRGARILDAGCATGSLLGYLWRHGFTDLVGLDPSPLAVATATRIHPIVGVVGSFVTPPADLGQFDLVMLTHVLEHLGDVRTAAASLARLVRPGGLAFLEVPDAARYAELMVAPFHDFNTEHINHFSVALLDRLATEHGFDAVDLGTKTVMCSARHSYPAAYGLFRKRPSSGSPVAPARNANSCVADLGLVEETKRYVAASTALLARIDADLRVELRDMPSVAIWGAGQLTMKLLCDTVLADVDLVAIVDGSPQKHALVMAGHVVQAPEVLGDRDVTIVIGSMHHAESIASAIAERLPRATVVRLAER